MHIFIFQDKFKNWAVSCAFALLPFLAGGQCYSPTSTYADSIYHADSILTTLKKEIKITFTGDIMMHMLQVEAAARNNYYDFNSCFSEIAPILRRADLCIGNLETTFSGKPYKGYPRFSSPDELAEALHNAGFDFLMTANNHSADGDGKGIKRTIKVLEERGLMHTGTFTNTSERKSGYPAILNIDGISIALLNYTFGTNQIPVKPPYIVNRIERNAIKTDLAEVKVMNPDFTIVFFHWGREYKKNPSSGQRLLAKFCFENGADFIVGAHPHVVQKSETIAYMRDGEQRSGYVAYSLGNFISAQKSKNTNGGIILELDLQKDVTSGIVSVASLNTLPVYVYEGALHGENNFYVLPLLENNSSNYLTYIEPSLLGKMDVFANDCIAMIDPYSYPFLEHGSIPNSSSIASITIVAEITTHPENEATKENTITKSITVKKQPVPLSSKPTVRTVKDTLFRVQFMASRDYIEVNEKNYPHLSGFEVAYENQWFKYMVGHFDKLRAVKPLWHSIRSSGHSDAFIVAYVDGVRIPFKYR